MSPLSAGRKFRRDISCISGAVLAQFNLDSSSMDLINADYVICFPLSYRNGPWSARASLFHQSAHPGDEFLLLPQRPELKVKRVNLSFETIELLGDCSG